MKKICVLVKKIFQFGGVLFSRRDLFLAKSDLASTISSNTMGFVHILFENQENKNFDLHMPIFFQCKLFAIPTYAFQFYLLRNDFFLWAGFYRLFVRYNLFVGHSLNDLLEGDVSVSHLESLVYHNRVPNFFYHADY